MDYNKTISRLKELEKVVDPGECNLLSSYLNGFITDKEEELHEKNLQISNLWLNLREQYKSDNKTDRALEITPEFRDREKLKLTISQLKRMRADLKDRFQVLTMTKRF
jgi:hypothetical protein